MVLWANIHSNFMSVCCCRCTRRRGRTSRLELALAPSRGARLGALWSRIGTSGADHPVRYRRIAAAIQALSHELLVCCFGRVAEPEFPTLRAARVVANGAAFRGVFARLAAAADSCRYPACPAAHGARTRPTRRVAGVRRAAGACAGAGTAAQSTLGRPQSLPDRSRHGRARTACDSIWYRARRRNSARCERGPAARRRNQTRRFHSCGGARCCYADHVEGPVLNDYEFEVI